MLSGAIIGALVGTIIAVIAGAQLAAQRKKANLFIVTLASQGPKEMRGRIDVDFPYSTELTVKNVAINRRRIAALGAVRDLESIEREVAAARGKPVFTCQVQGLGLLALALYGKDPVSAAARLAEVAAQARASVKGPAKKLVVPWTERYAELAAALAGQGPPPSDIVTLEKSVHGEPIIQIVVWQALVKVLEASPDPGRAKRFRADLDRIMAVPGARAA